jgi:serine/threonine protein kinase
LKQARQWEIDAKDLIMSDVIGKGYFGEVRRATWKGVEVAVKYMYRALAHEKDRLMFHKEILILRFEGRIVCYCVCCQLTKIVFNIFACPSQLRHPNIITLLGFVRTQEGGIMMVTELMNGGTLYHLIRHNFSMLDRIRTRIILDIVRGMLFTPHIDVAA